MLPEGLARTMCACPEWMVRARWRHYSRNVKITERPVSAILAFAHGVNEAIATRLDEPLPATTGRGHITDAAGERHHLSYWMFNE